MNKVIKLFLILYLINVSALKAQHNSSSYFPPDMYGGKDELNRFLHDHLVYPGKDFESKKEGKVAIYFIITKDGKTKDVKLVKSAGSDMNKEAFRLFNLIIKWMPATKDDLEMDMGYTLEIPFSISKYKKAVKERGFDTPIYTDIPIDTTLVVYETAEQAPIFNNPNKTFAEFVYTNLQYPETAFRHNVEGDVLVRFIVEPNGQTSNIRIVKGINGGCNDEAMRIIGLTKWKPAIKNKKYVRYKINFTVHFSLKNNYTNIISGSQNVGGQ